MIKKITYLFLLTAFASAWSQWNIYECNDLPSLADPAWYAEGEGPTPGVEDWFTVVNDPIIPGNNLLLFEELTVSGKESYAVKWGADKDIGATLVIRVKASDNLLTLIEQNTDTLKQTRWCEIEVRNGWVREGMYLDYNLKDSWHQGTQGYGVVIAQAWVRGQQPSAINRNFDQSLADWHIYRMTIKGDSTKVYLDENPMPVASGKSPTLDRSNWARIGDKQPGAYMGSVYDWIIWDVSGAYPAKMGIPIPRNLIGWNTGIEAQDLFQPKDFVLYPNFPNPFNPHTTIQFELVKAGYVSLTVYDVNGRMIRKLVDEDKGGGRHHVTWNGQDDSGLPVPTGVFVYEIRFEGMNKRGKMMLLK